MAISGTKKKRNGRTVRQILRALERAIAAGDQAREAKRALLALGHEGDGQ
jgi:hypothetical protein